LREGEHVGALARIEPAAVAAEEDFDLPVAFLQSDRMALAVIGRIVLLGHLRLIATGEQHCEAAGRQQAQCRAAAPLNHRPRDCCHRTVSAAQSRMKPYLP
jgi:hypothetical protein